MALSEHSKKLRAATAAKFNQEKLASGEYRRISLQGKAQDLDIIDAAIAKAGGSRVQALAKICREWLGD